MTALKPGEKIAVTGANGFIGAHCVLDLLRSGFSVVAVVRDPSDGTKTEFLVDGATKLGVRDKLSFRKGDLLTEGGYDEAFEGCDGVLHTAAIVEILDVKDADAQIVRPSVEGTRNVLSSVKRNSGSLKRYVHLSSCAAVQSLDKPKDHVFTEEDWNTWSTVGRGDPYGYGKTKAERMVWDFIKDEPSLSKVDAVVLNPVVVLGPVLCKAHTKSSAALVRQVLYGNPLDNYNASFVDVRDVASTAKEAFAKEESGGKRFLVCATGPSSTLILNEHVKKSHPWVKGSPPKYPNALIGFLGFVGIVSFGRFGLNEFQRAHTQQLTYFDAARSKEILGIEYHPIEDTCRDCVESMKPYVHIKNWGGTTEEANE